MRARSARGFTLVELLIVVMLIGILAALSAPFLVAAKASANEASAVSSLKALNSGQAAFATVCGGGSYTLSLATLVSEQFASPDLDITPKSGYEFRLLPGEGTSPGSPDCVGEATESGYYFSAEPLGPSSGRRAFATSQAGTVWQSTDGTAPIEPFGSRVDDRPLDSQ